MKEIDIMIKALSHPLRRELLEFVLIRSPEFTSIEIAATRFSIRPSIASKHMSFLADSGFLDKERMGQFIVYKLNRGRLNELKEYIKSL